MRCLTQTLLRFVPIVVLAGALASAQAADSARMDDVVQSYVKSGKFMGSVLVWKNGQALLDKGYGYANLEWQVPNSPDTKFRLGSMSKQFTAAAILLLQQRGKLNVNDPIRKYVPDAPAAWDKITLYHLLTHTSGVPNFTDLPGYPDWERKPAKPAEMVAWFKDKPLEFTPGSKWHYSNSGYTLLGVVIEKVSGVTYQQFLADNIFTPLGMHDSGYDSNHAVIARHASGYSPGKNGVEPAGYIDMSIPYSAGGLYSTTHDILLWEQGLFGGKLLNAKSLKTMTTPFLEKYGCGFWIQDVAGHRDVTHAGGIEGFNTQGDYLPDDNAVVVVLGNLNGVAPGELAGYLVTLALDKPLTLPNERKAVAIDPAAFDAYAGTYQFSPQFRIAFTRDGAHYYAQGTGQQRTEIFPQSATEFFAKSVDATFRFEAGSKPKVYLHQGGRDVPAEKVEP
jgi:CubicO group peptidase (beta-lactamase class C family)